MPLTLALVLHSASAQELSVSALRERAEQGDAKAQFNLGVMYRTGQGVPRNYGEAHKWFSLAGSNASDREIRDSAIKARDHVALLMTPKQIAEAQRLAREWKPKVQ